MSLSFPRETVDAKAHRLVSESRVTWAQGVAVVKGDSGATYVVRRCEHNTWSCTCPWGTQKPDSKPCSHILAAALTAPTPADEPKPTPAQAQQVDHVDTLDRLLAELKASLAAANGQAKLPLSLERPSHVVRPFPPAQERLPRNVRRHQVFVRVTDPTELAALRHVANPSVRYIEEGGTQFAVCEQAVLDSALAVVQGVCR